MPITIIAKPSCLHGLDLESWENKQADITNKRWCRLHNIMFILREETCGHMTNQVRLTLMIISVPSQVKADIKKRVRDDTDFNSQQFPNAHRAFSSDS